MSPFDGLKKQTKQTNLKKRKFCLGKGRVQVDRAHKWKPGLGPGCLPTKPPGSSALTDQGQNHPQKQRPACWRPVTGPCLTYASDFVLRVSLCQVAPSLHEAKEERETEEWNWCCHVREKVHKSRKTVRPASGCSGGSCSLPFQFQMPDLHTNMSCFFSSNAHIKYVRAHTHTHCSCYGNHP